jgi:alpha-glucosidase (family GH31 glycosyl hydrolase)
MFLADNEIPLFIKPGTILPLLDIHQCLSLTQCYHN